jgi:3D (Asp-Asp-Asp) domain-containing protein
LASLERLVPALAGKKMGKRIEKALVFTIVLLYQFSNISIASAAFGIMLNNSRTNDTLVESIDQDIRSYSFENLFSWGNKVQLEDIGPEYTLIGTFTVTASGYSSTPDQTDDSPCIAASGYNICTGDKNIIAANFYIDGKKVPLGTLVRIPDHYGDTVFVVEDRMNSRYKNNIDILFDDRSSALEFGRQKVTIEVIAES